MAPPGPNVGCLRQLHQHTPAQPALLHIWMQSLPCTYITAAFDFSGHTCSTHLHNLLFLTHLAVCIYQCVLVLIMAAYHAAQIALT